MEGLHHLHLVSLIFLIFSVNMTSPTKKICLNWSLKVQRKLLFFSFLRFWPPPPREQYHTFFFDTACHNCNYFKKRSQLISNCNYFFRLQLQCNWTSLKKSTLVPIYSEAETHIYMFMAVASHQLQSRCWKLALITTKPVFSAIKPEK